MPNAPPPSHPLPPIRCTSWTEQWSSLCSAPTPPQTRVLVLSGGRVRSQVLSDLESTHRRSQQEYMGQWGYACRQAVNTGVTSIKQTSPERGVGKGREQQSRQPSCRHHAPGTSPGRWQQLHAQVSPSRSLPSLPPICPPTHPPAHPPGRPPTIRAPTTPPSASSPHPTYSTH